MKKIRVALGLSGGVDSAVSAYLLKKSGYDVHCVYLNCFDHDIPGCRGDNDRKDALAVAMYLGLPFQILDFRKQYKSAVIDYFKKEYLLGRTPNPDVVCNRDIKFGLLLDWCIKNGFEYLATGHYAALRHSERSVAESRNLAPLRRGDINIAPLGLSTEFIPPKAGLETTEETEIYLAQPRDLHKDQTYFLWAVSGEKFKRVLFPLGNLLKTEVREIARKVGLGVAEKKDSTGICFVGEVRVEDFLKRLGVKEKIGEVVIQPQKVGPFVPIGSHRGAWFYTIGQRHGFEITNWPPVSSSLRGANRRTTWQSSKAVQDKPPLYVIEKDIKKNRLIVGFGAETYRGQFVVADTNWLMTNDEFRMTNVKPEQSGIQHSTFNIQHCRVRIRHGGELIPCSVISSQSSVVSSKSAGCQSAGLEPKNRKPVNQNLTTDNRKPITIFLSSPQRGIAPGQSAVFYSEDGEVLGGGIISDY